MLSKPPVTTRLLKPKPIFIAPNITDFIPDEQTLFIVVQGTFTGIP